MSVSLNKSQPIKEPVCLRGLTVARWTQSEGLHTTLG